ncbi:MAG: hypothetical protein JXA42_17090 [Anaerolineales bacterium]|nr:hypothetical protein [Anaerolineales bacterium]
MDIAERVDLLFKTITKKDSSSYSYRDIEGMAENAITSTSIWKVRTGKIKNPSQRVLQALSMAFEVPISYFFDENVTPEDIDQYRAQYRSEKMVEQIALRSAELNDAGKKAILEMIDFVRNAHKADH